MATDYWQSGKPVNTVRRGGGGLGTGKSRGGSSWQPGTKDGMYKPHDGYLAYSVPIGICGTSFGIGREFANVVAMDRQSDAGQDAQGADEPGDDEEEEGDPTPPTGSESPPHG